VTAYWYWAQALRSISIQEFAVYRVAGGRIIEVWGDLDRIRLGM
jgi:predicted ester cyclase